MKKGVQKLFNGCFQGSFMHVVRSSQSCLKQACIKGVKYGWDFIHAWWLVVGVQMCLKGVLKMF